MIVHEIFGRNTNLKVQHFEPGIHIGMHCGSHTVKLTILNEFVLLGEDEVKELIDFLSNGLPTEDLAPESFKSYLIGKSFSHFYNEVSMDTVAKRYGLCFEELQHCEEGSKEAELARKGKDETCLWIEHNGDVITDIIWG